MDAKSASGSMDMDVDPNEDKHVPNLTQNNNTLPPISEITIDTVIRKPTSAYMYFNKDNTHKVREELSLDMDSVNMGDVGKKISEVRL
jgi:hypothetical protein